MSQFSRPADLPLPSLADTVERWARAASALATGPGRELSEATRTQLQVFVAGPGAKLQSVLEEFAQHQAGRGSNWMIEAWEQEYLAGRAPLQLLSNVGFQLNVPGYRGFKDITAFIYRAAAVHLAQASGHTEQELGFRDAPMAMQQWDSLNGGLRHPAPEADLWEPSVLGAADRFIGVLARGRMWRLRLTDAQGQLVSPAALQRGLDEITAQVPVEPGFADISGLGSEDLVGFFPLIPTGRPEDEHNREVAEYLRDALFTVSVDVLHGSVDDPASITDIGRELTFGTGHAWVYQPFTYQVGLHHSFVIAHIEHSMIDGATLLEAWRRAQEVDVEFMQEVASERSPEPEIHELTWEFSAERQARRDELLAAHAQRPLPEATVVTAPVPEEAQGLRISADARAQLTMTIAQQLCFGRVRSSYESVDMREFVAGRTEVLRPVTSEAVELAEALAEDRATGEHLTAALEGHRNWVKAVKTGQGIDRHLSMLGTVAGDVDPDATEIFDNPELAGVQHNFLSTSSLGSADQIHRFFYAPAVPEGFGVNYSFLPEADEFLVMWGPEAEKPQEFTQALSTASGLFWNLALSQHTGA